MTSVTYIVPNSRTERRRKTKIGTEVALVTRDSDTTFARQAAASVGVGKCWPWETAAMLPSAWRRFGATGRGEGRGHRDGRPPTA